MAKINFLLFFSTWNCLFILLCAPGIFTTKHCNFKVNVEQNLRNNGFHRNLSYTLSFVNDYDEVLTGDRPEHCHIGLEQTLPTGLYFNPDNVGSQLAVVKTPVNIEDSAEEAKAHTVQMFAMIQGWTVNLDMQLHARYHAANANGGKVRNVIAPPRIYLNCRDDRLVCERSTHGPNTNSFCQRGKICMWVELPVHVEPRILTWDVPVGNTQDYYVVATGTLVSVVAGSLYLLRTVHEYMINNRHVKIKIK